MKYTPTLVEIIDRISPSFGIISLEDLKSPDCYFIEDQLKDIPTCLSLHNNQHGSAVAACGAVINALKVSQKKINEIKIVINGAGAAGLSITE